MPQAYRIMYLKRLELQGFKTFAQKTTLEFVLDKKGRRGITAVVGPNGSGKSNIADALRWVMGEQSLKLLRGKKSDDVIFSGSASRARSGFAEVALLLEKDRSDETDGASFISEIVITRRLYRDGQSEYEINRQPARLQDVIMLLAQCGVGQRTYSVIGQGMVDAVLTATPSERKEFFDEAFGLKPFQLKRRAAINKLDQAKENLKQSELLLQEIGPRLVSLERQVKRLQERESVEEKLRAMERTWYGQSWREIRGGLDAVRSRLDLTRQTQGLRDQEAVALEVELDVLEKATPPSQGFRELRHELDTLAAERTALRERQLTLETKRAVAEARAEKPWSPLPLSKIIESVDALAKQQEILDALLHKAKPDYEKAKHLARLLTEASRELIGKLQRPAPEPLKAVVQDENVERENREIVSLIADVAVRMIEVERRLEQWNREEEGKRKHVFDLQRRLNQKRHEVQEAARHFSKAEVEYARLETRKDGFLQDIREHAPSLEKELDALDGAKQNAPIPDDAPRTLQRLRAQIEWIGGIDPETMKEHQETKERFDTLSAQVTDLQQSIHGLEIVIGELDTTIQGRSATAFRRLNAEFGEFFKELFGGGEAALVEIRPEPALDEQGNAMEMEDEYAVNGIEIHATPPGKRNKAIALLSGGERALTSIALIGAIMATNPSPFVVLDEVDAALDESNSRKFAEIIDLLAEKTQFIVVSHNRATMQRANVLYGVTMRDDGVSQLLSVKLDEIEKIKRKNVA